MVTLTSISSQHAYWSGLPCPAPGDLPDPGGLNCISCNSCTAGGFFTAEPLGKPHIISQFSSVAQSCPAGCDPKDCSTPGFPVHHQLPELKHTHVHPVGDASQQFHPLSSLSPPTFNLSQHQNLFQWVSSSYQVVKVLEFQLQHKSLQWIFRNDFI